MGAKQTRGADGLTDLERRFGVLYLESFNATEAYTNASTRKVTRKTAEANGYRLLQKPALQKFVKDKRDALMQSAELTVEQTLTKLRQVLMYDVRKLFNADGSPKKITELDDDTAMAVCGLDVVTVGNIEMGVGEVRKYKLADRLSAVDKAMKYHGLFERDNKQMAEALKEITIKFVEPKK